MRELARHDAGRSDRTQQKLNDHRTFESAGNACWPTYIKHLDAEVGVETLAGSVISSQIWMSFVLLHHLSDAKTPRAEIERAAGVARFEGRGLRDEK